MSNVEESTHLTHDKVIRGFRDALKKKFPYHNVILSWGRMGDLIDIDPPYVEKSFLWFRYYVSSKIGKIRFILPHPPQGFQFPGSIEHALIQLKIPLPDTEKILQWATEKLEKHFEKVIVEWEYEKEET